MNTKHYKDGMAKNLAVIRGDLDVWAEDMRHNAARLWYAVHTKNIRQVPHFIHAFVTTTIRELYRIWGAVFWIALIYFIGAQYA